MVHFIPRVPLDIRARSYWFEYDVKMSNLPSAEEEEEEEEEFT